MHQNKYKIIKIIFEYKLFIKFSIYYNYSLNLFLLDKLHLMRGIYKINKNFNGVFLISYDKKSFINRLNITDKFYKLPTKNSHEILYCKMVSHFIFQHYQYTLSLY